MKKRRTSKKIIIDVRRPAEFEAGHAKGSINIPLQEMEGRVDEIRNFSEPIVLVCGGGTRHVKAFELLKANKIESEKGGGWKEVSKV